jgi:transglutaminase-like putative cysteine protease
LVARRDVCYGWTGPMRFGVRHDTHYRYDVPVVLAPHVLRLTPRPGEHRLVNRALVIWPQPLEVRDEIDAFGNLVARVSFPNLSVSELRIDSRFELETFAPPVSAGGLPPLPWGAPPDAALAAFRAGPADGDPGVVAFARAMAFEAGHEPVAFLEHLCRTMYARADRQIRPTGNAQTAAQTLGSWRGACRDLTVLFLAAARSLGIPGRFCSGYQAAAETPDGRRYLHAWPEVLLPGIGWRGWDPTHGMPVGEGHVALCAAPDQEGTMPVAGGFYFNGGTVTSTLDFEVRITTG